MGAAADYRSRLTSSLINEKTRTCHVSHQQQVKLPSLQKLFWNLGAHRNLRFALVIDQRVKAISVTSTAKGITSKKLLIGIIADQIPVDQQTLPMLSVKKAFMKFLEKYSKDCSDLNIFMMTVVPNNITF
ncbi:hypothetical protein F8388_020464 [Cannabis sativa]|uniref:Uncharacterized protein n=1 Tax=Cannabis sativa TaxID=3483 RepID=A0A7J6E0G0_CANSA|nr:hypothetical protein F8388_020464 [Cannabis sativa]